MKHGQCCLKGGLYLKIPNNKWKSFRHICGSHNHLLIQMSPSWIIQESIIMHSFCWRGVWGIKNRSERNGSTSLSGVPPLCFDCLSFFSPSLDPQCSRPVVQEDVFFWQALSRCPRPALDASLTGCGKSGSLTTALLNSVDGAARGFAESIF